MAVAGIYVRISEDPRNLEVGVRNQEADLRTYAADHAIEIVDLYRDNDVGAAQKRGRRAKRPEYERMLADVERGRIDTILVSRIDRLYRSPRDLEDLIDTVERTHVQVLHLQGRMSFKTASDRAVARMWAAMNQAEVESTAERLTAAFRHKAARGEPHGYAPYGYRRVDGRDVIVPEQAAIIREAAQRVLAGQSLRSVVADFNGRGILGPQSAWSSASLRQLLRRPSNAGLRKYRGQILEGVTATTEPILTEDEFRRLEALFTDPSRKSNHAGATPKYLLSGLAICGRCGARMRRVQGHKNVTKAGVKRQPAAYACTACFGVRRHQERVDELVSAVVIRRLSDPAVLPQLFHRGDEGVVEARRAEIAALDAKLELVADQFAADDITAAQLKRVTSALRERRAHAESELLAALPSRALEQFVQTDVEAAWEAADVSQRREIVDLLLSVVILPAGSGTNFDPELIRIEWR